MKLKLVDEMVESVYLCIILHVKNKKWSFIEVLTWINKKWRPKWRPLLMPSQASSSATTNKMYLILLRRAKAFHWRQNRLEILQHIKNWRQGFHHPPSPPATPLVARWGYELRVRPRVKTAFIMYGWGPWGCFSLGNEGWSPRDQIFHLHWPVPSKMNFLWRSADTKSSFLDLFVLHRSFVLFIFYRHYPYPSTSSPGLFP